MNNTLEQYIRALEESDQSLAHDRAVSFPQSKKTPQEEGETGIYHKFEGDLNQIKDRNIFNISLEECIKALESLGKSLIRDRAVSFPQIKKLARGERGIHHQLYLDLTGTKDREYIE